MDPLTIATIGGAALKGLGGFFGADSAEEDALAAMAKARGEYGKGVGQATRAVNTSARSAKGALQPFMQQGRAANRMYSDALGVNGADKQKAFFSSFVTDPGYEATLAAGRNQIEHSAIVGGRSNSGGAMKELFDYGQRNMQSQFSDRLDRLSGLGQQGYRAAGDIAGIETDRGRSNSGLIMDRTRYNAGNTVGQGQVSADASASKWGSISGMMGDMVSSFGRTRGLGGRY